MKGLTNLISFHNKVTHSVDEQKAADVACRGSRKAFDTVSHSVLLETLAARGLDMRALRWEKPGWLAGPKERW